MQHRIDILVIGVFILSCGPQHQQVKERKLTESYPEPASETVEQSAPGFVDKVLSVTGPSVIFYVPKAGELNALIPDHASFEGLVQAIGDFAYYAGIVSDSLESRQIPVYYTDQHTIRLGPDQFTIERNENKAPMGMILYDGVDQYKVLPGMQTHLSLLAAIADFFYLQQDHSIPLEDYFDPANSTHLHIYSSHSDILNQVGRRIDPGYYPKFGQQLARRAGKYHMSLFAYHKFNLTDSMKVFICRVPSIYDESSVKLYIWDSVVEQVVDEMQIAENVWNEQWILVKDSWITLGPDTGRFSFITRKKEARMNQGKRVETDSLFRWQWTGSQFKPLPVSGLSLKEFPLKDWQSYQEPQLPSEIAIIDEDYVWLPLETGDLTWENIIMELPKPYSIDKEPIENQLAARQIDTLITISRPNLRLKFYQAPDNILLVNGEVTDGSLSLKRGVKVGISKMDFIRIFEKLSSYQSIPDQIEVRSKTSDRIISYSFKGDTLVRIEFTNFIH